MVDETKHRINHYFPKALVYFLDEKWTGSGKLREAKKIVAPDISDIISINTTLNITSQPGTFSITLNNKNDRYFIKDDINFEVRNLNDPPLDIYGKKSVSLKSSYPYKNALEWLNHEEFKRFFLLPNGDVCILERYQNKKDGLIGYWKKAQNKEWLEEHAKEQLESVDTFVELTGTDLDSVVKDSRPNLDFYEKYEGMVDQGRCVFSPMDRVVVLFSRRFYNESIPYEYIVAFTGLVNSISDEYSENFSKITISGEDVTKWLKMTYANVNPSTLTEGLPDAGADTMRMWSKRFTGMEPWQIIKLLVLGGIDADGLKVRGVGEFEFNPILSPESSLLFTSVRGKTPILSPLTFENTKEGIVVSEDVSDLDKLFQKSRIHIQIPMEKQEYSDMGELQKTPYKRFARTTYDSYDNEYRTHLEIIYEIAKTSNFEFYADANGDIWYHQPRFDNRHILTEDIPEVYILRNEDILSWGNTESDESLITSILVVGQMDMIEGVQYPFNYVNFYEDSGLIFKYGRRMLTVSHPFVRTAADCYYYAQSLLFRTFAERRTGTITIVGRPEIRMAMPVYVPFRNMIYYVHSITHNFGFGETFTTTLGLTYGRKPWERLPETLAYTAYSATDGEVGRRNVTMESTAVHAAVTSKKSKDGPAIWPFGTGLNNKVINYYPGQIRYRVNDSGENEQLSNGIDLIWSKLADVALKLKRADVLATHDGIVTESGADFVKIKSKGGQYETHYYGLVSLNVSVEDEISKYQPIGYVEGKDPLRYCLVWGEIGFVDPELYTKANLPIRSGGVKS